MSILFAVVRTAEAVPTLPAELSGYVKDGMIAFWDGEYNSTNAEGVACHDDTTTTWIDLSGNGHDAKKAAGTPSWGANYLSTTSRLSRTVR